MNPYEDERYIKAETEDLKRLNQEPNIYTKRNELGYLIEAGFIIDGKEVPEPRILEYQKTLDLFSIYQEARFSKVKEQLASKDIVTTADFDLE